MKKSSVVLLALLLFFCGCQKREEVLGVARVFGTMTKSVQNYVIESKIEEVAKLYNATGIQVAIVDNGVISGTYAYGWATMDIDEMTVNHKLRIASPSKILVGLAACFLDDEGIVDLEGEISKFWGSRIRSRSYPSIPITIKMFLTHTTSMISFGDGYSLDETEVRNRFYKSFTGSKPGEISSWHYNNYAIRVLGMTLEKASGKTLDDLLNEKLFDVMDIDASFASGEIEGVDKLVTLINEEGEVTRTVDQQKDIKNYPLGTNGSYFSGGLTISSVDMAKILVLLINNGKHEGQMLIDEEYITWMETYEKEPLSDGSYQARPLFYGENIYNREGVYFHTGSAYGVYNCVSYDPVSRDGVVVLSVGAKKEEGPYDIYEICHQINQVVYNEIK